jgi:anti-sigma B factor antagonist
MEVTTTRNGSNAVLTLAGDIDVETAPKLDAAFAAVFEEGAQDIVVDVAAVSFLGSSGLSVLIGAQRTATSFHLQRGNRIVDRLVELTGLDLLYGDANSQ